MKHKLIFFAIAVFLCLGLISCNQAMGRPAGMVARRGDGSTGAAV